MKKKIFAAVTIFVCFLLQSTLFAQFAIGGIRPNLLMIAVAAFGFLEGKRTGIYAGFFSGILLDVSFGYFYGLNALLYMYVGYLCGYLKKYIFSKDVKLPLLFIVCSDLLYNVVYYILAFVLRGHFNVMYYLRSIILPEVVYTTVMACILYPMISFVMKYFEVQEKGDQQVV